MVIQSVFTNDTIGNNIMHGGDFGFEGSIVCTSMIILAIIGVLNYHKKSSLIQKATTANKSEKT